MFRQRLIGYFRKQHTIDARLYKRIKKVSLAGRLFHYGRYGENTNALFAVNNIAFPWYVRGYDYGRNSVTEANGLSSQNFVGDKMFVGNFEIRIPFTGPKQLSLIGSKFLLTDLNFFFDTGMVWDTFDQFNFTGETTSSNQVKPIMSAGASVGKCIRGYDNRALLGSTHTERYKGRVWIEHGAGLVKCN